MERAEISLEAERFDRLCLGEYPAAEGGGIGTLREKKLHAVLKDFYQPDRTRQEVAVGRYLADALTDHGVVEVQTGGLGPLRKKVPALLEQGAVTVVHPLPAAKYLYWTDPETGLVSGGRRSPKKGCWFDVFYQLPHFYGEVCLPGLTVELLLIDMAEYRLQNGWGNGGKRGSTCCAKLPLKLRGRLVLREPADFLALLPAGLPPAFTVKQLQKATGRSERLCRNAVFTLQKIGVLQKAGKQGRSLLYSPLCTGGQPAQAQPGGRSENGIE